MTHPESKLQADIVKLLQAHGVFCHAVPNEGAAGNKVRTMQMITMGLRPGVADLVVWWRTSPPLIGYLEIKTPTGKQSPAQVKFQARCLEAGVPYDLARSVEDVEKLVDFYSEVIYIRTQGEENGG
jgi:hypothetical protein